MYTNLLQPLLKTVPYTKHLCVAECIYSHVVKKNWLRGRVAYNYGITSLKEQVESETQSDSTFCKNTYIL